MSHANPLQPGWDQGFGKTLPTNLQAPVYLLCGLGTQMHRTKLSAVLTVTEPPYLSWALSIELRKHRDMRLSHCPKWDLAKNVRRSWGAFHTHRKQPKACCGDGRHRCVDTRSSYSLATSSPQPDSLLLLHKPRPSSSWIPPPPGGVLRPRVGCRWVPYLITSAHFHTQQYLFQIFVLVPRTTVWAASVSSVNTSVKFPTK